MLVFLVKCFVLSLMAYLMIRVLRVGFSKGWFAAEAKSILIFAYVTVFIALILPVATELFAILNPEEVVISSLPVLESFAHPEILSSTPEPVEEWKIVSLFAFFWTFFFGCRYLTSHSRLKRLLSKTTLIRRVGRIRVVSHPEAFSPFTYFYLCLELVCRTICNC